MLSHFIIKIGQLIYVNLIDSVILVSYPTIFRIHPSIYYIKTLSYTKHTRQYECLKARGKSRIFFIFISNLYWVYNIQNVFPSLTCNVRTNYFFPEYNLRHSLPSHRYIFILPQVVLLSISISPLRQTHSKGNGYLTRRWKMFSLNYGRWARKIQLRSY